MASTLGAWSCCEDGCVDRKSCHVLVDPLGLVLHALVTAADVQDRDGGILLLSTLFGQFPFLRKLFADSA